MIEINARGARTLADAKPLTYDGQNVYVTTTDETAQLHLAGRIVAERPASEITCILDAQDWAYEVIETANEIVASAPAADAIETLAATDENAVYGDAVAQVHQQAVTAAAVAATLEALGDAPHSFRNSRGRKFTVTTGDPRHPARRAATLRREAAVLAAWTARDEADYGRYVSDGLADTDGWYAPLGRSAWHTGR